MIIIFVTTTIPTSSVYNNTKYQIINIDYYIAKRDGEKAKTSK